MKIVFLPFLIMSFCPPDAPQKLYDYLKPKMEKVTWVDINPQNPQNPCQFSIRYYPCNAAIQNQIDELLPKAIYANYPHCVLQEAGKHRHTEGFCTLADASMQCKN